MDITDNNQVYKVDIDDLGEHDLHSFILDGGDLERDGLPSLELQGF